MARSVRLFLIRHGETVDNVAGLYAGVTDSELTNHGYQQAARLGVYFKDANLPFTHIFSSHLQRAVKTAGKIREAQFVLAREGSALVAVPEVQQLSLLVEQDFGSMEGKKFAERLLGPKVTGNELHSLENKRITSLVDIESKDSMAQRADGFLDAHLLPLLDDSNSTEKCIAVVSHGIFLSTLWKRLLRRLPAKSIVLSSELQAAARPSLEHLGGWSNTGYLELSMVLSDLPSRYTETSPPAPISSLSPAETPTVEELGEVEMSQFGNDREVAQGKASKEHRIVYGWQTTIVTINGKDHLKGLKRTGGGVGSSRYDISQKSIDTYFKRQRVE